MGLGLLAQRLTFKGACLTYGSRIPKRLIAGGQRAIPSTLIPPTSNYIFILPPSASHGPSETTRTARGIAPCVLSGAWMCRWIDNHTQVELVLL